MRVVISAGGTGGHIYPALAILNKIKEMEPNSEFLYIGTTDRMEATIVPNKNIPYVGIKMKGMDRKHPWKNVEVFSCFQKAIRTARKEIRSFRPDVVLGIGGYITAPVVYAGFKEHIPTFIHEQNSIPGLSNRFLSRYATKIGVSFEETISKFPKGKAVFTGNPRSEEVSRVQAVDKKTLGLSPSKKLVVIVMGSLGSTTITERLMEMIPSFAKCSYEVLIVTGKNYFDHYQQVKVPTNVKVVPYLDNMLEVLKKTDLVVSRAGASTIAEITALGVPSILVPSPYVTHNHQMKNALSLKEQGACLILEENLFTKEQLLPMIDSVFANEEDYQKMKENTKKMGICDSTTRVYRVIKKMTKGEAA